MENKNYQFVGLHHSMNYGDGVYNGRYNGEMALIRMKDNKPVFVTFIGFMKWDNELEKYTHRSACIYNPNGIILSSIELLRSEEKLIEDLKS